MHEWAVAESVVKTIKDNINRIKNRKVEVLLGELQAIDKEVFKFAMDELLKQYSVSVPYSIVDQKVRFKCNSCGYEFNIKQVRGKSEEEKENIHFIPEMVKAFVECPRCKSVDFEIIEGRGVSIRVEE